MTKIKLLTKEYIVFEKAELKELLFELDSSARAINIYTEGLDNMMVNGKPMYNLGFLKKAIRVHNEKISNKIKNIRELL